MKGDFSRLRLEPEAHHDAWLQQQGRVFLDSDWNEATMARLRLLELQVAAVVGAAGAPRPGTGFRISAGTGGDFRIGGGAGPAGHLYVDGILCRNERPTTYATQPDLPAAPPLALPPPAASTATGALSAARAYHAVAVLHDGTVLVVGGWSGGVPVASAEVYDRATGRWTAAGSLAAARVGHTATVLPDGTVLVVGGSGSGGTPLASAELYDPATRTWKPAGSLAEARAFHAAALVEATGDVLVCGGAAGATLLASAELYDRGSQTWTAAAALHDARALHTTSAIPRLGILAAGGRGSAGSLATAEVYDAERDAWTLTATPMSTARERHTATPLGGGRVLVAGGWNGACTASAEIFDGAAWRSAGALHTARASHSAVAVGAGRVLAAGGAAAEAVASTEVYDAEADAWVPAMPLQQARFAHAAVLLGDDVLVAGGASSSATDPNAAVAPGDVTTLDGAELATRGGATAGVAYVEAWRRLVTYRQDAAVREVALGGPDTTVRLQTVAQVRVASAATGDGDVPDAAHAPAYLPARGAATLSTVVPPAARGAPYTGRDNRLYRIEIHQDGERLGGVAPPALALGAAAAKGALTLELSAPLDPAGAAALLRGRWQLDDEPLLVAAAAAGSQHVRLDVGLASGHAAGTTLQLRQAAVRLTADAAVGGTSVTVDPAQAAQLGDAAAGDLARRAWLLRSPGGAESVTIARVDLATGVATLAKPLAHAHAAGSTLAAQARYKWSRDNASFAVGATVLAVSETQTTVSVDSLGADEATALREGDIVELVGDRAELGRGYGLLARIANDPHPETLTLVLDAADPQLAPGTDTHLVLRRWDGVGLVDSDPVDLGEGVHVRFGGSDYVAGDYWWVAARAIDGSLDALEDAPPVGIVRRRVPLAALRWSGDFGGPRVDLVVPYVPVFDPLTGLGAGDVAYDDRLAELGAGTVQEALDALVGRRRVWPTVAKVSWEHDRELERMAFEGGLVVTFSEAIDRASVDGSTFVVTLELPAPNGTVPFLASGTVAPTSEALTEWRFLPGPLPLLNTFAGGHVLPPVGKTRCRVLLRGGFILSADGGHPLDGDAFGVARPGGVGLRLPSGDGVAGGDFESWFWLQLPAAPQVKEVTMTPVNTATNAPPATIAVEFTTPVLMSTVTADTFAVQDAQGRALGIAQLGFDGRSGTTATGATLTYSSYDANVLAAGHTEFTLTLVGTGASPITDANGLPLDGKSIGAGSDYTKQFWVDTVLASFELGETQVVGGESVDAKVTLWGPAPPGGAAIALAATDPAAVTLPSVTVPAGTTEQSLTIDTAPASADEQVTISATYGGDPIGQQLTIQAPTLDSINFDTDQGHVVGGKSAYLAVNMTGVVTSDTDVSYTSDDLDHVPAGTVTVAKGNPSQTSGIPTKAVQAQTVVTVTATCAGVSKRAQLTLLPASGLRARMRT